MLLQAKEVSGLSVMHVLGGASPGGMEEWPAMERWQDLGYLVRVAGARTVPIEVGSHYLAEGWGQQLMPLADFITRHVTATRGLYGREHE